jgi:ornithine carbamoyltransferase
MRHLLNLLDPDASEIERMVNRAAEHAANRALNSSALSGMNIGLLFEKASTRTRLSFQVAVLELGGNPINLDRNALQIGRGESWDDTLEVMARYLHALVMRTDKHANLELLARRNLLPIINGLTDRWHPCQILADIFTIQQLKGKTTGLKLAFIGEGNNVFNSLALAGSYTGLKITLAHPAGYGISPEIKELLAGRNIAVEAVEDPAVAARDADILYTDVWVSMGQESEKEAREELFKSYCISLDLVRLARPDCIVMHCLPAYRNKEIMPDVMQKFSAVIFRQAENRLHAQKAILEWIFGIL